MQLITKNEIVEIFADSFFYETKSIYILEKESKSYDQNKAYSNIFLYAEEVKKAYNNGNTIIVKNIENLNQKIKGRCLELGRGVDVHMYLVSKVGGESFDFHIDDRNVFIHMIYGEKKFILKNKSEEQEAFLLGENSNLYIKQGVYHKAEGKGPSCLLSFGIPETYPVYGGINLEDLS